MNAEIPKMCPHEIPYEQCPSIACKTRLRAFAAPSSSAAALKQQVSKILMEALQGSELRYRMDGYIRWGLVEREIHQAIETVMNEVPPNVALCEVADKARPN